MEAHTKAAPTATATSIPETADREPERDAVIASLETYFADQQDVTLAILFGSVAKGTHTPASDIDVAIHTEPPADISRLIDIRTELSLLTRREVDLVDLHQADGIILTRILSHGVRIKDNPNLYASYNLKAIYFNEDYLPLLRRMQKAHIERFIHGS